MQFARLIEFSTKTSSFLFGPRMTGKTTILRSLNYDAYYDFLDPALELRLKTTPEIFREQLEAMKPGSCIIIDEIQKVPAILNYVQMGIDRYKHVFLMSGSSARKLRRGAANLLGGRALDRRLHPLIMEEISEPLFNIHSAMQYGTLPKIYDLLASGSPDLAKEYLKSYVSTYLKEEIQAEALTRNLGAFNRFLAVAAQCNGQIIEYQNISRECSVPASTVKEYYQILEDTLTGFYLWPYGYNERKKSRPKFYLFDCGVTRAIQNRLSDPSTPQEQCFLFETWCINELIRMRDYLKKDHVFSFWRHRNLEIDLIISNGPEPVLAVEFKSGKTDPNSAAMRKISERFRGLRIIVASLTDTMPRKVSGITVLPWKMLLEEYRKM